MRRRSWRGRRAAPVAEPPHSHAGALPATVAAAPGTPHEVRAISVLIESAPVFWIKFQVASPRPKNGRRRLQRQLESRPKPAWMVSMQGETVQA